MSEQCRACLSFDKSNNDIFTGTKPICDRFSFCTGFAVESNDGYPPNICNICLFELDIAYKFRKKCEASRLELMKLLDKCTDKPLIVDEKCHQINDSSKKCHVKIEDDSFDNSVEALESDDSKDEKPVSLSNPTNYHKKETKNKSSKIDQKLNLRTSNRLNSRKKLISIPEKKLPENSIEEKNRDKSRKHMCTICGKTFPFHNNLLSHERVHSGDKPYTCEVCNRSFTQAGHLLVHERIHSGIKPYKCNVCPRAFTVSHTLKKHLRTHTGERPYACKICNKAFVTSYHLSNHHKRHAGDKMFKCDWKDCQHSFVNISEMKRHRTRHEKIKSVNRTNKNLQDRLQSIESSYSRLNFEGFSSRLLTGSVIIDREKQMQYPDLMQLASSEYYQTNNAQDMSMLSFHTQLGSHSSIYKNARNNLSS